MSDASVRAIDGRAVVTVGGSELLAPIVAAATDAVAQTETNRAAAELASATAIASSRYFPTRAAGQAASSVDQMFSTDDGAGSLIYYRRTSSASVEIGRAVTPGTLAASTGTGLIGYLTGYVGSVLRTLKSRLLASVDVMDFGAVGDGATNDTAAFNAAIATGRRVRVRWTPNGYAVNRINVVKGMHIEGEKNGISGAPILWVNDDNAAAFYNDADDLVSDCSFRNLGCSALPGVTGASFYDQATRTKYSAYFTFKDIETHLALETSYKGLFIFTTWDGIRDGYSGSPVNGSHTAIEALAESYGQTNRQNINHVKNSQFFSAYGTQGVIVASYGTLWTVDRCDFEALNTAAFRGYNITQLHFSKTWFEGIGAAAIVALSNLGGAESSASFEKCACVMTNTTPSFFVTIETGTVAFRQNVFNLVTSSMRLINNGARVLKNEDNWVTDAGAATFMDGAHHDVHMAGRRRFNGASDNGIETMTLQNEGGIAANGGFMSDDNIVVGSGSFVTIARSQTGLGGECLVSGFDPAGGGQFRIKKEWQGLIHQTNGTPMNNTGKTMTFQIVGNDLQMKVDAGSVSVFTTMLH